VAAVCNTTAVLKNCCSGSEHIQTICSTWGNGHYKTFDGDVYQFPGTCEYNLASDCHDFYLEFSVHIQRAERGDRLVISQVVVTIKNIIVVLRGKLVSVNGDIVKTPYYGSGVLLEKNEVYTKLYAKLGLTVMWNGEDAIMLELDSKYRNRTCGLCGDYNGISMYNEFIYEGELMSPVAFGNLQKIHKPSEECEDPYEESTPSCSQYRTPCEQLLKSRVWADCKSSVDPEPYVQACIQDMCSCNSTLGDFCVCSTLSEFSRQCSHAGGTPQNWRTEKFCAKQCPFNMVYLESGSPCMNTCSHTDTSKLCEEHRMDGCFCPAGTVFDDVSQTGCIPVEQCQCNMHGKHYQPGETVQQECEECVCESGKWACKSRSCPGSCAVEGGAHISTFDGKTYTFHGNCYYVLSKDCDGARFSILGELVPCGSKDLDTCLKTVVVLLDHDTNNALVFKADGKVLHNSAEISLPYNMAHLHVFRPSSFHIILQSDFGLQLQVQLVPIMQVYVSLEQSYKTKMCGLCGDFNDVQSDDFKTQLGLVEGTAAPFANSWKAQASCPDRSDRLDDPCALSVETENYAEHWCSVLETDRKFAECHALVNPKDYYKKCVYSTCNCEKSEDCLCAALSSYVRACAAKGVTLQDWRSTVCDKYKESCPATQTFSYGLHGCQRTCLSLSSDLQYCSPTFLPVDGCTCPDGLYQDEGGICVPMASCPCFHNGDRIQPGKSITIEDEHCTCTNGTLDCQLTERSINCPSHKIPFSCSTAMAGSPGLECEQTCRNPAAECYTVGCVSGCKCPDGLYDDGMENCVLEHQCPCFHNGDVFPPGVTVRDKCNTCTCKAGQWQCTKEKCPGTCTIYGSGHYITFDEQRFGFDGDCGYVAAQDFCGDESTDGTFSVITENIPCGTGTTCSKSVRIYMGRTELKLSDGKYEVTKLDWGEQVTYRVRSVGMYLVIETSIGLKVLWDRKTALYIILDPSYAGQVCGLCGNFDDNGKNDFTTKGQLVVASPLEFGNSWKVSSSCPDAELNDPCSMNPFRHGWAKLKCSIIRGETFQNCHYMVDPTPYYDACVTDSCSCDGVGDCECFCTAVAAYAEACNKAGVCVAWRTPEICPVFCDFYNTPEENCTWHYSPCHPLCYKTCRNPEENCSSSFLKLEGCYPTCPSDKPFFDEDRGACVEKCTCSVDGTPYLPGQEVPSDQCTTCRCTELGTVECTKHPDCCEYNGVVYSDGHVISSFPDHLGMCSYVTCKNGTVIKSEQLCASTTPPTTNAGMVLTGRPCAPAVCEPRCEWSEWFDVDFPGFGPGEGERETYEEIRRRGYEVCSDPIAIECRAVEALERSLNQTVHCELSHGLICRNDEQKGVLLFCLNYEIRVYCCRHGSCTTTPPTTLLTTTSSLPANRIQIPSGLEVVLDLLFGDFLKTVWGSHGAKACKPICKWTEWFDVSYPKMGPDGGDWETYENIKSHGGDICDHPEDIRCRAVSYPEYTLEDLGQRAQCNVSFGLICKNRDNMNALPPKCYNYEIQVSCCMKNPTTTVGLPTTSTTPECFCVVNGTTFNPGDVITDVNSVAGSCFYDACSDVCKIERHSRPCTTTPTPSPTWTTPRIPECPGWNKKISKGIKNYIQFSSWKTFCSSKTKSLKSTNLACTNGRPPVLVWDDYKCCQHFECECYCIGFGDPHYVTFDGLYYSFQGNCTYVLVEEINPVYPKFGIYIDNVHCDPREEVSCPRSIIVSFGGVEIALKDKGDTVTVSLEVLVDNQLVQLPFKGEKMRVVSSGLNLVLEIPDIGAVVTFSGIAFSVKLPYFRFGNNTQGQCGTCTNNQTDDCMLPGGRLVKDCAVMGEYWLHKDEHKPHCTSPPPVTPKPPSGPCKPHSVCDLLKSKVFAACHKLVPPEPLYQGCVFDSCHMENSSIECTSLQTYASMCAQLGVCVSWRDDTNGKCPPTCLSNMVYRPCGPAKQPTCEDHSSEGHDILPIQTEGCFCPEGSILYNKHTQVCVEKCGCLDPAGVPREFGETFEYNCQNCICDFNMKGVRCEPKECLVEPKPDCSGPGFVITSETSSTDPCCKELVCRCNASFCPPNGMLCLVGFQPVVQVPDGKCCPEYKCVPKEVCVHNNMEYQPGSSVPVDKCQLCSCTKDMDLSTHLGIISCAALPCNRTCEEGFQYVGYNGDCCGKCVQTHCVIEVDGTIHVLEPGEQWSPLGHKCEVHSCAKMNNAFISTKATIQCPAFHENNCQPGTIVTAPDGCCKTCVEKQKACKVSTLKTHITDKGCQSQEVIEMTHCQGACDTYSIYSAEAASMEHKCACCQEVETHEQTITVICPDGTSRPYTYIYVDKCDCRTTSCDQTTSVMDSSKRSWQSTLSDEKDFNEMPKIVH
ncbi:MUC2 protein, partial [Atractosteus spatula]|nr:MUC2 protein [Atractosteus spatula]